MAVTSVGQSAVVMTIEKRRKAREPCSRPRCQASKSLQGSKGAIGFRITCGRTSPTNGRRRSVLRANAGVNWLGVHAIRTLPTLTSAGSRGSMGTLEDIGYTAAETM